MEARKRWGNAKEGMGGGESTYRVTVSGIDIVRASPGKD